MLPGNTPENSDFCQFFAGDGSLTYGFPAEQCLSSGSGSGSTTTSWKFSSLMEISTNISEDGRRRRASDNHKEAERKRRQRINYHLNCLTSILPSNSKTDKASLLAKVVQRVRELKQQTSEIMQSDHHILIPSETDEISVFQNEDCIDGKSVVNASFCCEDRADLISDLIEILKPLPLRPLRAEMVTLGGRTRNVVVFSWDENEQSTSRMEESVVLLRDALTKLILMRSKYWNGDIGDHHHQRFKRRKSLI